MKKLNHLIFFILLANTILLGQESKCRCLTDNKVNICYLSVDQYCYGEGGCNHTIDGEFMDDYIALKLTNENNFGIDGISSCAMNLLKVKGPTSVKEINDQGCHVFLIGSFPIDTTFIPFQVNSDKSGVPIKVLKTIREWSMQCDNNLTIVSQAEAAVWGYKITNSNVNPNTAITDPARFNLFSGPFGNLKQFMQGGSYQGVITETPSTGTLILAKDAKSKPTVAFDELTNDLILGDIGIICGLAGNLTKGPQVDTMNNNDKLAANMFALGCNISKGTKFSDESVFICPNTKFTLPNGIVVDTVAVIPDTMQLADGCDSIHIYKVFLHSKTDSTFVRDQCVGDKSQYTFRQTIFDEFFPQGKATLINTFGCEYTMSVNLTYHKPTFTILDYQSCIPDNFILKVGNDIYDLNHPSGNTILKDRYGCDSSINVNIQYLSQDTTLLQSNHCLGDSVEYHNKFYAVGQQYMFLYTAINPCDSLVILSLDTYPIATYNFPSPIDIHQYRPYVFNNNTDQLIRDITWLNADGLSCNNCINPIFDVKTFPTSFEVEMKDIYQCSYTAKIDANYICAPLLPNVFAPTRGTSNQYVDFNSLCPFNSMTVTIYDRWGGIVFHSNDSSVRWDGRYNGSILGEGVYTYIQVIKQMDGTIYRQYGNITLLK